MTRAEFAERSYAVRLKLAAIFKVLDIAEQGDNMAVDPTVAQIITEFDAATDAIAARIARILAAQPTGINDETKQALEAEVTKLQALGKDPQNPTGGVSGGVI